MSLNKILAIFGIILVFFVAFIFYQFNVKSLTSKKIPSATVSVKGVVFNVELAKTQQQQQKGLSGRSSLPQDRGMLFLFNKPGYYAFWMKDMKFPLDMLFIDGKTIITIYENIPPPKNATENGNLKIMQPTGSIDKVLEINAGMVKKYGIKTGDAVKINL